MPATPPSREDTYLLSCLTSALQAVPLPDPPVDLDWDRLLQRLLHHRLAGLFAAQARSRQTFWPADFLDRLRRERIQGLLYGQAFGAELARVLSALNAGGIPVIVLKGWALIQLLYDEDPSQRIYADADLLVPPAYLDAGEQVLLDLGYRLAPGDYRPGYSDRYAAHLAFSGPRELTPFKGHVQIELHWTWFHRSYFRERIDIDSQFARATPITICGAPALALNPTDMILHLAAHQFLHHGGEDRLARDFDLAAWIVKHSDIIDWSLLARQAHDWRLVLPCQQAFQRLNGLWPGILPVAALTEIQAWQASSFERLMFRLETSGVNPLRMIENLLSLPSADRLRYLLETAFPSQAFLRWRYGRPPFGIWPLLHLVRLGTSLGRILRLIFLREGNRRC